MRQIPSYLDSRAESLAQVDVKGELPTEVMHWCKTEGMFGLSVPRELGGKDYLAQGQIFFHMRDPKTRKDIRENTESWKVNRENMFFFQKWLNFENLPKQNCNKI